MKKVEPLELLMRTFLGELKEHVEVLNHDLLALEKGPPEDERSELVKSLFRVAHTLRGAAESVNVTPIATASHELEGILTTARDEGISLDEDQFELFFAAVDAMAEMGRRLDAKEPIEAGRLSEVTASLAAAAAAGARAGVPRSD